MSMQTKLKPIGITLLGLSIVLFFLSATTNPIFHMTVKVDNSPDFIFPGKTGTYDSNGILHVAYRADEHIEIQAFISSGLSGGKVVTNVQSKIDQSAWGTPTFISDSGETVSGCGLYRLLDTPRADNVGFWDHTMNLKFDAGGVTTKIWQLKFILDLEGPGSPPTIAWVGLTDGQSVSGTVNIRIVLTRASWKPKSAKMTDVWTDNTKHDYPLTLAEYPSWAPAGERWGFQTTWDTTQVPDGSHRLDIYIVDPNNNLFGPYSIFAGIEGGTEPFWRNPLETIERAITFGCSISVFIIGLVLLFIPMPPPRVGKHF